MIIVLAFLTVIFSFPVRADYVPIRYSPSPLITPQPGSIQNFQVSVAAQPYGYGMWYSVSDGQRVKIGVSRSANGVDWYSPKILSVTNRLHAHDPSVLFQDSIYTLYFGSSNGSNISIWKNSSQTDDGFVPENASEVLVAQGGWEGTSLSSPFIFRHGDINYLLYAGNGNGQWKVGMAYSPDSNSWIRCPNNPINNAGSGPSYVERSGASFLFFNSPRGVEYSESTAFSGCDTQWSPSTVISNGLGNPNPIEVDGDIRLYGDDGYGIGLLSERPIKPIYPIVIVPGMFSSWNTDAVLHNANVTQADWHLNSVVTEYIPLMDSLTQLGYSPDKSLFLFSYDWRKHIESVLNDLDAYMQQKVWNSNPYLPVQLVGHSLGGLITHIYGTESENVRPIKKIISVAAPLRGTIQSYKPIAAGEIERDNSLAWLAQSIVLHLNTSTLENKKDTVSRFMPVLSDLIPTYPFLFNENGSEIYTKIQNPLLGRYPVVAQDTRFIRFAGIGYDTQSGYTLSAQTPSDQLFNIYPDGHPITSIIASGDKLISGASANSSSFFTSIADHGETIYRVDFIQQILQSLGIDASHIQIPPGKPTPIFPALFVFLQSPAEAQITKPDGTMTDKAAYLHLSECANGDYTLKVTGTETGSYTLHTWLVGSSSDIWKTVTKQTYKNKVDKFTIQFSGVHGGSVLEYVAPTPTPKVACIRKPSISGYPHWCSSPLFMNICAILKNTTNVSRQRQNDCRSKPPGKQEQSSSRKEH